METIGADSDAYLSLSALSEPRGPIRAGKWIFLISKQSHIVSHCSNAYWMWICCVSSRRQNEERRPCALRTYYFCVNYSVPNMHFHELKLNRELRLSRSGHICGALTNRNFGVVVARGDWLKHSNAPHGHTTRTSSGGMLDMFFVCEQKFGFIWVYMKFPGKRIVTTATSPPTDLHTKSIKYCILQISHRQRVFALSKEWTSCGNRIVLYQCRCNCTTRRNAFGQMSRRMTDNRHTRAYLYTTTDDQTTPPRPYLPNGSARNSLGSNN